MNQARRTLLTDLTAWLTRHGYAQDRWGHWQRTVTSAKSGQPVTYRYKISSHAVRKEVKSSAGWVRLGSAYLKDFSINESDQLVGLRY